MKASLIKEIDSFSRKLFSLSRWGSRGDPFGHLRGTKDDYIYEFWCGLKIINDLSYNYKSISLVSHRHEKLFPIKPGLLVEGGFAYFTVAKKSGQPVEFQIFLGIKIVNSFDSNDTVAPDISFIQPIGRVNPCEKDVLLVMDAKYRTSMKKKLTKSLIKELAKTVDDLGLRHKPMSFLFHKLSDLNGNCLLTNGQAIKKHKLYCQRNKILQVGNFISGKRHDVVG